MRTVEQILDALIARLEVLCDQGVPIILSDLREELAAFPLSTDHSADPSKKVEPDNRMWFKWRDPDPPTTVDMERVYRVAGADAGRHRNMIDAAEAARGKV